MLFEYMLYAAHLGFRFMFPPVESGSKYFSYAQTCVFAPKHTRMRFYSSGCLFIVVDSSTLTPHS